MLDPRSCPGACNGRYRREHHAYDDALAAYQRDLDAYPRALADWHPPLVPHPERPEPPAPPRTAAYLGSPVWCGTCTVARRTELAALDDLACLLVAEADGHRGVNGEAKVSRSAGPASPSPTLDEVDELESWLRSWQAAWTGTDTLARRGGLADAVTRGVAWLHARADRMLAHPDLALPYGQEIHGWYTRLARASRSDVRVQRKPLPCPGCDCKSLEWPEGADKVACARADCARVLTLGEYEALVEHAARDRGLVRAAG